MPSIQAGVQASSCTAVVYDLSQMNNAFMLEGIELSLKVMQAITPLDEQRVALDIITGSSQGLGYTKGLREPFHACQWGLGRS